MCPPNTTRCLRFPLPVETFTSPCVYPQSRRTGCRTAGSRAQSPVACLEQSSRAAILGAVDSRMPCAVDTPRPVLRCVRRVPQHTRAMPCRTFHAACRRISVSVQLPHTVLRAVTAAALSLRGRSRAWRRARRCPRAYRTAFCLCIRPTPVLLYHV